MNIEPVLELDDIQGNIIPGFKKDCQHFLFFRIIDQSAAKAWLKTLIPRISTAREVQDANILWKKMKRKMGREPDNLDFLFLNCALSAAGLVKLGIDGIDLFDDIAFKLGIEARSKTLGDPERGQRGSAETWLLGGGQNKSDVLIILASDNEAWAIENEEGLIISAQQNGLEKIHVDRGRVRPGDKAGHEHFGFKDGVSMPAVRGRRSLAQHDFFEPRTWPLDNKFDEYRERYAGSRYKTGQKVS